jgi:hypothetical protein
VDGDALDLGIIYFILRTEPMTKDGRERVQSSDDESRISASYDRAPRPSTHVTTARRSTP